MSLTINLLSAEHKKFYRLLDKLAVQLVVDPDSGSPDYRQMMAVMEQLMPGSEPFHDHCHQESLLFEQLSQRRKQPLLVLDALEQQRRRVGAYRVEFVSLLCASMNGELPTPGHASLAAAMDTYSTAFRAQIAYEEHVMFPVLSALSVAAAGVH